MAKRLLFLFSDTGGGHRASANAIIEALNIDYPDLFETEMVDFLRQAPIPLRYAPEIYPPLSNVKGAWRATFVTTDGPRRRKAATRLSYPYIGRSMKRLIANHPADLIVSVHPIASAVAPRAARAANTPFITVVTDMVSAHAFWFAPNAELTIVPTEQAKNRGIRLGTPAERIQVVGQPVSPSFTAAGGDKDELRREFGWEMDRPVILLVGGGDGMGPIRRVARAINDSQLPISLAVVCGRNEEVWRDLTKLDWRIPHHLYGFTTDMPRMMRAADVFLTKAGPGSISEAFICGLPIIMYSCLPGQEEGNVDYVLDGKAGYWAPNPEAVVRAVATLAENETTRQQMAEASRQLARPQAAFEIARVLAEQVGIPR